MIHVRKAGPIDCGPMTELLNEIILRGGTTAMTKPATRNDLVDRMQHYAGRNAWSLAEDDKGCVLGFQWIEPHEKLPPEAADIATFTRIKYSGLGVASSLFERTKKAAVLLGYEWINATIRADNEGGLAYYQSRGFETYKTAQNVKLLDEFSVDRISKRYDLEF